MADPKSIMDTIAGYFNQSQSEDSPTCQNCGHPIPGGSGSPAIDPSKAKANEADAQKSGFQPSEWKKNIKSGLGLDQ